MPEERPTMNLLLDTNVVIDYLGRKPPFFDNAKQVMAAGFFGDVKLWMPAPSLKDAFYVLSRYANPVKVQKAFCGMCEVVSLVGVTERDVLRAARLEWNDFEDCLVSVCAEKAKADYLITRDAKGFSRSSVPTIDPAAWIDLMRKDHGLEYDIADI